MRWESIPTHLLLLNRTYHEHLPQIPFIREESLITSSGIPASLPLHTSLLRGIFDAKSKKLTNLEENKDTAMKLKVMRRLAVALACALSALGCHAEYLPFLEVGKWWAVVERDHNGNALNYWKVAVASTEMINGRECFNVISRRIYPDINEDGEREWIGVKTPFNLLQKTYYEDNGTIYEMGYVKDQEEPVFVQLFMLDMSGLDRVYMTTVEVDGVERNAAYLEYRDAWLIEGIGASTNFWGTTIPISSHLVVHTVDMLEYYKDGRLIFTQEDFENLIPPTSDNIEEIPDQTPQEDMPLMNLQGKRVTEPHPGEIYITGGKKVLKK